MMKKLSFLIIFLGILFFFPLFSNADISAPIIIPYKVRTNKINGIDLIDLDGNTTHVSYDTILEIIDEIKEADNLLYGHTKYNNKDYYVNLADVELLEKDMNTNGLTLENEKNMYVYENGAYLYKGASKIYGKVEGNVMLPVGTTITVKYNGDYVWGYVEYNGIKGWVYIYPYKDCSPYEEYSCLVDICDGIDSYYDDYYGNTDKLFFMNDMYLTKSYSSAQKNNVIIPAFTYLSELTYKYSIRSYKDIMSYCVEYRGQEGWYSTVPYEEDCIIGIDCREEKNNTIITINKLILYDRCGKNKGNILTIVPANTELHYLYKSLKDEHRRL